MCDQNHAKDSAESRVAYDFPLQRIKEHMLLLQSVSYIVNCYDEKGNFPGSSSQSLFYNAETD
ncbi:CPS_collapsed_G0016880.mRNA.1.CDS.1 [Saccharomyces cerevisiae]|nr:CPS_collapsed_G0016880.mRNA.1.CDS.1 [Saccharomyces cerevisiae]